MGTDIVCMECGKDMVLELREKGICMNKENFGTYEAMDSYAREYDIEVGDIIYITLGYMIVDLIFLVILWASGGYWVFYFDHLKRKKALSLAGNPMQPLRDFAKTLTSETLLQYYCRSLARMEEVVVSPPVQKCVDMEVDKVEGDANLTELKKPKKRRRLKSKKKLLVKGEDTENPNTTLGAIASVDQEMIVTSPAANGDGKSSISSTNAPDKTASNDIISPAATADQNMIVLNPADTVDGKSSISSTNAPDKTASQDICRPPATADQNMIVLNPADTVDGKSSISSTNAPDKTASHDILGPAAIVDQQMTVLSPAPVQECLVVETDKDEFSAKVTTRKKNRRRKLKIKRNKNLESLDKREGTENPGSLGEIASVDPKMMVLTQLEISPT
ncbi:hypothetical protein CTI12_AA573630 [Artemisia annua]|uniref:Uncharacterized protein n=1 Tax=Artemisia annua TaxID=35608 RepID=A0A2U1KR83_ARTAN|nr:hypothetical protein CTI12_AA573630 [Artemisia annua]